MTSHALQFPKTDATLHKLANGLEVILREDYSAPLVSVQAWVKTGSIFEGNLLGSGVSHLVEHMVFKGAGGRGPSELAQAVQATGGYLNAYTSFDRTVYWVDTLAEGFPTALDVVSALVTEAEFPEEEYEREKDVIRREMDMGKDDPSQTLNHLLFQTVYRQHPYKEPVIGHLDLFNAVDRAAAQGYYKERYSPRNMFLVIAGAMSKEQAMAAITERLGAKENQLGETPVIWPEPRQMGRRDAHEEFATDLTKLEAAWRIPSLTHADNPALEVLGVLLGSGRSCRLNQRIREQQRLVHDISAGAYTPSYDGLFYVGAELDFDKRAATEAAIFEEIRRVQQDGVTEAEVAKARRIFLSSQLSSLVSTRGQASDLGSNWLVTSNLDFSRDYLLGIDQVTPAAIQKVAQDYLVEDNLTVCSLNPKGSLAQKHFQINVSKKADVERVELDNGTVLLLKEDPRLPFVAIEGVMRGGLLSETSETNGRGGLLARVMPKGAGSRNAEAVAEATESLGASVNASSGGSSCSVSAHCMTPDLATGLEIWSDVLLRPHLPEEEIEAEKERMLAKLKSDEDSIGYVATREMRRQLYGEHPFGRVSTGSVTSIPGLNRGLLVDFRQSNVVTGNLVVSCYGDIKAAEMKSRLKDVLAPVPQGSKRLPQITTDYPDASGNIITLERDKQQAFLVVGFPTVEMHHPDHLALELLDEACSDMASRLFIRIREEHGLAYSVGTHQLLGMVRGAFLFHLSTAPEKLEFAQAELMSEIGKIAKDGLTSEEISRAKKTWLGKHAMRGQSNAGRASAQAVNELFGMGYDADERDIQKLETLSAGTVAEVAARYFGGAAPTIVRVKGQA
jgi:zinc protease